MDVFKSGAVTYYVCSACRHVWTIPKDDPEGPVTNITLFRPKWP